MKKSTKGAVACGAAALILAGGAGSMAAWNASTTPSSSTTATAGSLGVTAVGTPAWTWTAGNTGAFTPSTQTLSPGDSVHISGQYTLSIVGTNLKATATVTNAGATGLPTGLSFTADTATVSGGADLNNLSSSDTGKTVTAGGTLTFDKGTADNSSQGQSINVSGLALTLTQK